jgi:hypothetical protein
MAAMINGQSVIKIKRRGNCVSKIALYSSALFLHAEKHLVLSGKSIFSCVHRFQLKRVAADLYEQKEVEWKTFCLVKLSRGNNLKQRTFH